MNVPPLVYLYGDEPFLIQQGFLMRTPRGRVVTSRAYSHFGFKPQGPQGEIEL